MQIENFPGNYLLVDDDEVFAAVLAKSLKRLGIQSMSASNSEAAISLVEKGNAITHAVVDLNLNGDSGLNLIPRLLQANQDLQIVVLTGYSSIATTVEAMKRGAKNYLCKPAAAEEIVQAFSSTALEFVDGSSHAKKPGIDRIEWEHIQKPLQENNGNVSATARVLGMHRRTLQRKLQKKPGRG